MPSTQLALCSIDKGRPAASDARRGAAVSTSHAYTGLEMPRARGAWNRQQDGRPSQEPGERDLRRRRAMPFRDSREGALPVGSRSIAHPQHQTSVVGRTLMSHAAGLERLPWHERDPLAIAVVDDRFPFAVRDVVTVLHRDDGEELLRALNLRHADFRKSHVPDLAFAPRVLQEAELLFFGHRRIDAMELIEFDAVEPQPPQAALEGPAQTVGATVDLPSIRTRSIDSSE